MKNDIIQLEGGFYNKCKVVMLFTDKPSPLVLDTENALEFDHELSTYGGVCQQHLHILSDDQIKDGDWFYDPIVNQVLLTDKTYVALINAAPHLLHKKVIATTDSSLEIRPSRTIKRRDNLVIHYPLPRPSDAFIQKYIEEYNRENIIEEVLVEYETDYSSIPENENEIIGSWRHYVDMKLKVTPDNTITIKPTSILKPKMYSKEDVIYVLQSLSPNKRGELENYPKNGTDAEKIEWGMKKAYMHDTQVIDNWIKENM